MGEKEHTCCFFGHRKIEVADEFVNRLEKVVDDLIVEKKVDTFLFGSKSDFNSLCLDIASKIKVKSPGEDNQVKRGFLGSSPVVHW